MNAISKGKNTEIKEITTQPKEKQRLGKLLIWKQNHIDMEPFSDFVRMNPAYKYQSTISRQFTSSKSSIIQFK